MDYSDLFAEPSGIYLLSHSVGCPPRDAPAQLDRRLFAPWRVAEGDVWQHWLAEVGGTSEKLENAFKGAGSFKQTGVASRIVEIWKAEAKPQANRRDEGSPLLKDFA